MSVNNLMIQSGFPLKKTSFNEDETFRISVVRNNFCINIVW